MNRLTLYAPLISLGEQIPDSDPRSQQNLDQVRMVVAVIQAELMMTMDELHALPVSVDLVTAGRAFGIGRTKAFELAKRDKFPCRVLRVGEKYRVPRSAIFEALGIDPFAAAGRDPAA